jgi:hypothetical protein
LNLLITQIAQNYSQLIVKMPPMQMYTFGGGNGIGTAMEMAAIPPVGFRKWNFYFLIRGSMTIEPYQFKSPSRQFLQKQPEEQQQSWQNNWPEAKNIRMNRFRGIDAAAFTAFITDLPFMLISASQIPLPLNELCILNISQ